MHSTFEWNSKPKIIAMKNGLKITLSIAITVVLTFLLNMVFMYLLKMEVPYSYLLSVIIGGGFGWLFYKSSGDFIQVMKWTIGGWAIAFVLGFLYFLIIEPKEAQGMFAIILFIAPAGGVLGLAYGILNCIKDKKLRIA